ncbi:MAG: regulatory protein RecX [Clostridia bacterium]|nr:regulatory protein RecX [Clostridia bacterium]
MILITVTDVQASEGSRGKFLITVKLSTGQHEEIRTFSVFRYFLKNPVFSGILPSVGDFLGAEKFEALEFAEECSGAAIKAVSFLAFGDNTSKKLSEKLRQKGFSREAAAEAVRFCVEKHYINEEDHLRRLMEQLCERKKYGLRRIRQEVYNKGFSEETVNAVFEDCAAELDFDAAATERVKKLGADAFSTPEKKKKQVSSLLRYGFSMDEINRALKAVQMDTVDDF